MNALLELVSSRAMAEVLRLLFGSGDVEMYSRELVRKTDVAFSAVQRELKRLTRLGILTERRDGNRTYYRANTAHPLFPDLRNIVIKTCGIVELLRAALAGADVQVAFVFGSIAAVTERPGSDVDVMVIGDASPRDISGRFFDAQSAISREINPYVIEAAEWQRRLKKKDHFLTTVMDSPRLFVIGTDDELKGMAGARVFNL